MGPIPEQRRFRDNRVLGGAQKNGLAKLDTIDVDALHLSRTDFEWPRARLALPVQGQGPKWVGHFRTQRTLGPLNRELTESRSSRSSIRGRAEGHGRTRKRSGTFVGLTYFKTILGRIAKNA